MAMMTNEQHREAGISHLDHIRELLKKHGDRARLELHADHMRSLIAAASPNKNVPA
ncbi:hypothetical protein LUI11_14700 [Bradyrhizobium diazoefficiens]|uniref:hypothetical protein n=1 Tax=Bradyrhizobium TaxID=374 RepID=UPI00042224F6|nr:hypothetical protein [Bradyrhizobium diazoefficiens]MCD9295075.1 hypothetical protein [Bradyrhizobium diazoefficiens]MCD9813327.1 hypothetical protein [Bradyrhizobium diazoefficiens]MCD9829876.1 hypothetical protein [Bradyrhizobium diazoefficiens]MCD9850136.1 hypothetical protein [Bradyrhizobium diazoefficiens]MCD9884025.1 hypothetical protein [Bradyrhizobium diazoefficiens]